MRKTTKVTQEEYKNIEAQSFAAREVLEDERFQFIRDYFRNAKEYIENSILNNTVREVQEVVPVTDKLTRIFKTTKKVQVDELSGQYKLIVKFLDDLEYYASLKKDLDQEISDGRIVLE